MPSSKFLDQWPRINAALFAVWTLEIRRLQWRVALQERLRLIGHLVVSTAGGELKSCNLFFCALELKL